MGRPTKLTPTIQRRIIAAVAGGNTRKVAAEAAGIGETTLYRWMQMGAAPKGQKLYREFWESLTRAEAGAVMAAVGTIRHAGRTNWQAMTWWLERRYPDEWGRKDRVELSALIRREAERIAGETGLNVDEIVTEAEAIIGNP